MTKVEKLKLLTPEIQGSNTIQHPFVYRMNCFGKEAKKRMPATAHFKNCIKKSGAVPTYYTPFPLLHIYIETFCTYIVSCAKVYGAFVLIKFGIGLAKFLRTMGMWED